MKLRLKGVADPSLDVCICHDRVSGLPFFATPKTKEERVYEGRRGEPVGKEREERISIPYLLSMC